MISKKKIWTGSREWPVKKKLLKRRKKGVCLRDSPNDDEGGGGECFRELCFEERKFK